MKYIKYTFFVLLTCTVALLVLYKFYRNGYKHFYAFEHERLEQLINGKEYNDILFLGSSRSYFHVNPRVVDSITKAKSFNGGIEGGNILETNLILKCYLASHEAPKMVVIDVATPSLNINTAPGFRPIFNPNRYYPFIDNPHVFNALKPYKHVYMLKYLPFTQFTEADDVMRQATVWGNFGRQSFSSTGTYHGYRPRNNDTLQFPLKKLYDVTNFGIEEEGIAYLKESIELCQKKGIKVVLTFAPAYKLNEKELNPEFFPTITKIAETYNIPFWNYKDDKIGSYHKLFCDEIHLNNSGTYIYSAMLGEDINNHFRGLAKHKEYNAALNALYRKYDSNLDKNELALTEY